jgi:putative ABC transport system permease protein
MPRWAHVLRLRIRSLFRRARVEADLHDELHDHLERRIAEAVARGMPERRARTEALRALGGLEPLKETLRDTRRVAFVDQLVRDVQYGARMLRRSPTFTAVALLSLSLGTGANIAIFQLLDAVRLRPLPVVRPDELAVIEIPNRGWPSGNYGGRYPDLTYPQWEALRAAQQGFSGVFAWSQRTFDLAPRGESRFTENGLWVSGEFFEILGVRPAAGRLFSQHDDVRGCGTPRVVLSHAFWQREFGAAPSIVGKTMTIEGLPFPIIGVAQAGFYGIEIGRSFDIALPLCAEPLISGGEWRLKARDQWWLAVMGRLRPGWSLTRAASQLESISPALFEQTLPENYSDKSATEYRKFTLTASAGVTGFSRLRQDYDISLWLLLAVAGIVLLIACANLANLMLARMGARDREMAVRLALGASRGRLVRQLFVESLLLAMLGAGLGMLIAPMLGRSVVAMMSTAVSPMFVALTTDWLLLGFVTGVSIVTCVLFGLAPALRSSAVPPGATMLAGNPRIAGHGQLRLRRILVVAQVALSLVLLVGGLLFGRSLFNLLTLETGFTQAGLLELDVDLSGIDMTPEARRSLRRQIVDDVRAMPDVEAAAAASNVPLVSRWNGFVLLDGPEGSRQQVISLNRVTARYFETMRVPILAGRDFTDDDTPGSTRVAIVNQVFLETIFGGGNPVGRQFLLLGAKGKPDGPALQIVGLVGNTKYNSLRESFGPIAYVAETQLTTPGTFTQVLIRSHGPLGTLMPAVSRTVEATHPGVSFHFHDFEEQLHYSLRQDRLLAWLCGFFAMLGTLLATVGVYGVIAYLVVRRTNEIGIRLALGARRRAILALVLREATTLVAIGLGLGVVLALGLSGSARAILYGITPTDVFTVVAAVVVLGTAAVAAAIIPARRAATLDPARALRTD